MNYDIEHRNFWGIEPRFTIELWPGHVVTPKEFMEGLHVEMFKNPFIPENEGASMIKFTCSNQKK